MTGGGGGSSDHFGSEILAKSEFVSQDFLGSRKKIRGIFLDCENRTKESFWYAKNVVIFLGRQILKL